MRPPRFATCVFAAVTVVAAVTRAGAGRRDAGTRDAALDPGQRAAALIERARNELATRSLGGPAAEAVARAEDALVEALRLRPGDFTALLLLGDARALAGRSAAAIDVWQRALMRAPSGRGEADVAVRVARAEAARGRFDEAVEAYDRAIRLGLAEADTYTDAGAVALALGRTQVALGRLREAARRAGRLSPGPARTREVALAGYVQAAAAQAAGDEPGAREAVGSALAVDPGLRWISDAGSDDERVARAFIAPGSRERARALALALLGRGGETQPPVASPPLRIVAVATVKADGPLPAPLVDAAWKSRPDLLGACIDGQVAHPTGSVRLTLQVTLDEKGRAARVDVEGAPAAWGAMGACIAERVRQGLVVAKPGSGKRTHARIELLLAPRVR